MSRHSKPDHSGQASDRYNPDWFCTVCGCSGMSGEDCGCNCTGALGIPVHGS